MVVFCNSQRVLYAQADMNFAVAAVVGRANAATRRAKQLLGLTVPTIHLPYAAFASTLGSTITPQELAASLTALAWAFRFVGAARG
jgi:hypothetical protein